MKKKAKQLMYPGRDGMVPPSALVSMNNLPELCWERSGSLEECLTRDRGVTGLSLTGITVLWSLSKTHLSKLSTGSIQEDLSLHN